MRIGLDVMGGDYAPDAPVEGAILAQQLLPADVRLVLIGDEQKISELLAKHGADKGNFDIVHTPDVIGMGEHPTKAFTQKPNSSIAVGFGMLAAKKLDAFASNGNTGAMLVGAMFAIKAIPGVIRPCITTILPKEDGSVGVLLDVGINADCKPDVLSQFGLLGSLFAEYVYGIKDPKVGLLNIGEEPEKGNLLAQAAHSLMKENKDYNFIGNIEGRDIFDNKADVVVCDGFTGNVVLKLAESTYTTLKRRGLCDDYFERYNYENYGGTPLLGVNSTVMIGHGISNAKAVKNMLLLTKEVVDAKLSEKILKALSNE
jgi:phosphate acyltransferase